MNNSNMQPVLIFIYGPMCSGKTTLANSLSKLTGWQVVDSDEVMSRIHPNSDYSDNDRADMYAQTFKDGIIVLGSGRSVIVACAFTNEKYIELLKDTGLYEKITKSILLKVSPDVAVERWRARGNNPKIQTEDIIYQYALREFPKLPNALEITSDTSPAIVLRQIISPTVSV